MSNPAKDRLMQSTSYQKKMVKGRGIFTIFVGDLEWILIKLL